MDIRDTPWAQVNFPPPLPLWPPAAARGAVAVAPLLCGRLPGPNRTVRACLLPSNGSAMRPLGGGGGAARCTEAGPPSRRTSTAPATPMPQGAAHGGAGEGPACDYAKAPTACGVGRSGGSLRRPLWTEEGPTMTEALRSVVERLHGIVQGGLICTPFRGMQGGGWRLYGEGRHEPPPPHGGAAGPGPCMRHPPSPPPPPPLPPPPPGFER